MNLKQLDEQHREVYAALEMAQNTQEAVDHLLKTVGTHADVESAVAAMEEAVNYLDAVERMLNRQIRESKS